MSDLSWPLSAELVRIFPAVEVSSLCLITRGALIMPAGHTKNPVCEWGFNNPTHLESVAVLGLVFRLLPKTVKPSIASTQCSFYFFLFLLNDTDLLIIFTLIYIYIIKC